MVKTFFALILSGAKEHLGSNHVENLYQPVTDWLYERNSTTQALLWQQGDTAVLGRTLHGHHAELMRHAFPGQHDVTLKFTLIQSSTVWWATAARNRVMLWFWLFLGETVKAVWLSKASKTHRLTALISMQTWKSNSLSFPKKKTVPEQPLLFLVPNICYRGDASFSNANVACLFFSFSTVLGARVLVFDATVTVACLPIQEN